MSAKFNSQKGRKKQRRVFGRVRNVECQGVLWTFEMHRDVRDRETGAITVRGGVTVKRRGKHRASTELIPFDVLTSGGGCWRAGCNGVMYCFRFSSAGVEVRQHGRREWRLVSFANLANAAQPQPELFA